MTKEVREYVLDERGRAVRIRWKDGSESPVNFKVDTVLGDYGEADDTYARSLYWEELEKSRLDRDYRVDEASEAQVQALETYQRRNPPPPPPPPQVDLDFASLSSPHEADREQAKWILQHRTFIDGQLKDAVKWDALGHPDKARACRERAGGMTREIENRRKETPYQHWVEKEQKLVELANRQLAELEKLSPEEIEANRDFIEGLLTSRNHESDEEFSYVINEASPYDSERNPQLKVTKVYHQGQTSQQIQKLAGESNLKPLDYLIRIGSRIDQAEPLQENTQINIQFSDKELDLPPESELEKLPLKDFEKAMAERTGYER